MKFKKRGILLILAIIMAAMMCSCHNNTYNTATKTNKENGKELITYGAFIQIPGEEDNGLYYHKESKTVYIIFDRCIGLDNSVFSATPYIDDGHYFEYIDGKIVPEKITSITSNNNKAETADQIWETLTEEEKRDILSKK